MMFAYQQAYGDVTFSISPTSTNAAIGTQVTFSIAVTGFDDLNGFQFPLDYDETKLQYVGGTAVALSATLSDTLQYLNFVQASPSNQWIRCNYFYFNIQGGPTGRTIPNGTTILTLRFNKIAAGTTDLHFSSTLDPVIQVIDEADELFIVAQGPHSFTASANPPAAPAPLTFTIEKDTIANAGGSTCVSVRTKSFTNMANFQFGMTYDTTKLVVPPTINLSSALSSSDFLVLIPPSAKNQIRALYTAPTTTNGNVIPATLPDSTQLFEVCFTAKAGASGLASVPFATFQTPSVFTNDFSNTSGPITNAVLNNGSVQIGTGVTPPPTGALTLTIEKDTIFTASGSTCVSVRAKNFTNMVDFQFGMTYDTAKLVVPPTINLGTALGSDLTVLIPPTAKNQVRALYTAPTMTNGNAIPSTLPDSTMLFEVCFTAKAGASGLAPVSFAEFQSPTVFTHSFSNTSGLISNAVLTNGSVLIVPVANPCSNPPSIPTGTIVSTPVSCFGGANGAITVFPTGGTAPYTVTWTGPGTFTATGPSIFNLGQGTYTPRVTDAAGCSATTASGITIAAPASAVNIVINSITNVPCFDPINGGGNIQATTTGGTTPYNWSWARSTAPIGPVASTEDISNQPAGTYGVTVTDNRGCTAWANGNVITSPSDITVNETHVNITCPGGNNGSITVTASGGTPSYNYQWTPTGPNSGTRTALAAGTYTVTVIDMNGCIKSKSINLTSPPTINNGVVVVDSINCPNQTGGITIAPTGGNGGPFSVIWMPGSLAGTTISNLAAGTYTPTITDKDGCVAFGTAITLTNPNPITISNAVVTDAPNGSITLTVSGGTGPLTYQWSGASTATTRDLTGLGAGTYTVTVKDAKNCSMTQTFTVGLSSFATVLNVTHSCGSNAGCVQIEVTGLTPPFNVKYGSVAGTFSTNPFTVCGLSAGNYNFMITDPNNVSVMVSATVNYLTPAVVAATVTNVTIDNVGGKIKLTPHPSAPGAYSYLWANGATSDSLINLDAGNYCVTITNTSSGCTSTDCYEVKYPDAVMSFGQTNPKCGNTNDGTITLNFVGGNGPIYHYLIRNAAGDTVLNQTGALTQVMVTGLQVGTYTAIVYDETPSPYPFAPIVLSAQSNIMASAVVTSDYQGYDVSSPTNCNGIVEITPSMGISPYQVLWSNGGAANNLINTALCVGDYGATITDAAGCATIVSGTLEAPSALVPTASVQSNYNGYHVSCNGTCNGIARVVAIGGIAPYTVKWSNGETGTLTDATDIAEVFGLCAGTYTITITDAVGATQTGSVVLLQPDVLDILFTQTTPARFTSCDGIILANTPAAAGTPSYTWTVVGGASGTGPTVDELCAGKIVTFLVTDQNGCTAVERDTMPYPSDGCLEMSPVITPGNLDGKNDAFYITCIEATNNNRVEIFNRWGQMVFDKVNYDNQTNRWEGLNSRGQALPEGVYFVVVSYTNDIGETFIKKTYVNLLRS